MNAASDHEIGFPPGNADERELLLGWLDYLRGAVIRKAERIDDEAARWTPEGHLLPLVGIVNHLANVERRWIDFRMRGRAVSREESEFFPGPELAIVDAISAYKQRAALTNQRVREASSLITPCLSAKGTDLRWVLLHLINETARHAGHADAVRELLDRTVGE